MLDDATIAQVRSVNRTVTQRVWALVYRYLARDRTLGACRVLWEIGTEGCEVRSLRARLELDSGQTSRLLRTLEDDGLIELSDDGLRVTSTGRLLVRVIAMRFDRFLKARTTEHVYSRTI